MWSVRHGTGHLRILRLRSGSEVHAFPIFLQVLSLRCTSGWENCGSRRQGTQWGTRWFTPLTAVRDLHLYMGEKDMSFLTSLVAAQGDNAGCSAGLVKK